MHFILIVKVSCSQLWSYQFKESSNKT